MEDHENLYDKIREILGSQGGSFNILEDEIDVGLQMEYFEFSKRIAAERAASWAIDQIDLLEEPDTGLELLKEILARLASTEEIRAYRAIENYCRHPDPALKDWSLLALQESRMHLESELLEENQVFISTGLGGRDNKLRYFVALISRMRKPLTPFQVEIIGKEFRYIIEKRHGEIEEYEASGYLATFMVLLPLERSVKRVFEEAIDECNQYGDFLRENCIVTNVKKLSFKEITEFIEQKKGNRTGNE